MVNIGAIFTKKFCASLSLSLSLSPSLSFFQCFVPTDTILMQDAWEVRYGMKKTEPIMLALLQHLIVIPSVPCFMLPEGSTPW